MSVGGTAQVLPSGLVLDVLADETVFAAAHRSGYRWPTVCRGQAQCTACRVWVLDGMGSVEKGGHEERDRLLDAGQPFPDARLACRLRINGVVVLRKPGVRPVGS